VTAWNIAAPPMVLQLVAVQMSSSS
jgi:hypothetical protein